MIPKKFIGSWTIDETSEWEADYLHMIKTAKIEIHSRGIGRLHFGTVEVELDLEPDVWNPKDILHFSFEGDCESDATCGRGSLKREGSLLIGHLAFHLGDRSTFKARK